VITGYAIAVVLAIMQLIQLLPENAYFLGFSIAVLGSLILLVLHFLLQKEHRREISVLLGASAVVLIPILIISVSGMIEAVQSGMYWGLLAMPILPGGYFIAASRKRLGGMELRVNRVVSTYVFLILLSAFTTMLIYFSRLIPSFPGQEGFFDILIISFAGILSAFGYPEFIRIFEKRFLGIKIPTTQLMETYAERISTSLDFNRLIYILRDELLPSLLVRQSALLRVDSHSLTPVLLMEIDHADLPEYTNLQKLLTEAESYRLPDNRNNFPWVHLIIPIQVEGQLLGLWLFGRRDPDDYYSVRDIKILKPIASQIAITLANIFSREQILGLYENNILRHEEERKKLAHNLHDEILNGLAVLGMLVDDENTSPEFQREYENLTRRIRHIISGLRPAMLEYGLFQALEELAAEVSDRINNQPQVNFILESSIESYENLLDAHIYRITQQALENAIQHAQAAHISVSGELSENQLEISIEDDGLGFSPHEFMSLSQQKGDKHYGLIGMHERAEIIGARLHIQSSPGNGTRVTLALNDVLHKQSEQMARIKAEEALVQSEAKASTLMNVSSDVIMLLDLEDHILDANQAMAKRIEKPMHEVIGKYVWDFVPSEVAKSRKEHHDHVRETGESQRYEDQRAGRWHDNFVHPIKRADGTIIQLAVFSRDITDRKQLEEALQESVDKYQVLLNVPADLIALHDLDGTILEVNQAMAERFNQTPKQLIGRRVWDFFPPEVVQQRKEFAKQVIKTGQPARFQDQNRGEWFDTTLYPLFNTNEEVNRFAVFVRQIDKSENTDLNGV
jgi:PAS domain S-box-containing protein